MNCKLKFGTILTACGKKTDSGQEMIALGLGSVFCSFFGSMPLTASFSRSSVLSSTGNKTPFASFFNGIPNQRPMCPKSFINLHFFDWRGVIVERIREMNEISCRAGAVILLALSFLMPTFSYIPKSVLGAVIVTSVFPMIEFDEILPLWKGRRKSLFTFHPPTNEPEASLLVSSA